MKKQFLELIDQIPEIESKFHTYPQSAGIYMPPVSQIGDVPEFQEWIQNIQLELQDIIDRTKDKFATDTLEAAKAHYGGWHDKNNFALLKGKLLAMRKNIERYYPMDEYISTTSRKPAKVFVSHATKDKPYVEKLVALLEYMGLDQTQLFCSSVPGYDIKISTDICQYLREQFLEYDLHVIFVHSPNYYKSAVCLNEMGAAWALKSEYTSMLLPGFKFEQMVGVIDSTTIGIKLDNDPVEVKDKLNQLYAKITDEFSLKQKPGIVWEQKRDRFINEVCEIVVSSEDPIDCQDSDIELLENGLLIRKSDEASGKTIYYCPACFQNHNKLFPIVKGSMARDRFCSNCKTHYTIR